MQKKISSSLVASFLLATTNLYSAQNLETITVTSATKSTQSIKDVTSNIEVITKEEIEERHFTTVSEALNTLAGFNVISNGGLGNSTSVFLRGMDTDRVLVLIDGIRFQDPSNTSGAAFEHLLITDIERIEVIKGAQSGIWGSDASAGVINIITQNAQKGTHVSFNSEYGSFQTKKVGMSVSNKTDKYDVRISANRIVTDGFSSQVPYGKDPTEFLDNGYRNTTVNLKAGYNITDSDKILLNFNHINSLAQYDGSTGNETLRSDNESNLYSIAYNKIYENHNIKLKYNLSKFDKETMEATNTGVKFYNGKNEIIELLDSISYFNNDNLVIGVSDERSDVDFTRANGQSNDDKTTNKAIYITNTNTFGDLTITESLRRDDYSSFGDKVTGKIGAKYIIIDDLVVSANYGTAYNAPNLIQLLNPWGTSNFDLNPEKIKGYDLSVMYKDLTITYFDNKVSELINWQGGKYTNVSGTSRLKGYESKYSKEITKDLLFNINYTHLSAKDSQDKELARRAKRQVGFGLDYYGIDKLHFNVNGQYIGDRYNSSNKTGRNTGNYTVWNSVINYDINKTFKAYLKVDNLFNKYYQTIDGYATAERSAYVGLKATF